VATEIRVYNTLSRQKERFEPVEPGRVGIYLCGPTVYKEAHIGHMVGPVIFDTIKRFLTYCGYDVNWIVNITDVDDKLIAQSRHRGVPMSQIATEMTMDYCANLLELGVDQISAMPTATGHMSAIVAFIEKLIERGYAYAVEGDVFFDVNRDPEYGKLSNRTANSQQGEGGEAAGRKRAPGDFALWKSAKPGEPSWPSPWGPGRPGWHIECSAMSRQLLGETFDIHGGGLDLIFPHHENEVAQSECCHGRPMARYWMHNGLLRAGEAGKVGGRGDRNASATTPEPAGKMSRSQGAGGLRALIQRRGGECLRFFLLRTHYRSTIVFGEDGLAEAGTALDKFYQFFQRYERITGHSYYLQPDDERTPLADRPAGDQHARQPLPTGLAELRQSFLAKMCDDFNTGAGVSDLFQILTALNKFADQHHLEDLAARAESEVSRFTAGTEVLRELSSILGLFRQPARTMGATADDDLTESLVQLLIRLRADARRSKDFGTADRIRNELSASGVVLEDRKEGTTWSRTS
jgi:cysteinyl-tRNA synthetase